jgi:hypothetical protein
LISGAVTEIAIGGPEMRGNTEETLMTMYASLVRWIVLVMPNDLIGIKKHLKQNGSIEAMIADQSRSTPETIAEPLWRNGTGKRAEIPTTTLIGDIHKLIMMFVVNTHERCFTLGTLDTSETNLQMRDNTEMVYAAYAVKSTRFIKRTIPHVSEFITGIPNSFLLCTSSDGLILFPCLWFPKEL